MGKAQLHVVSIQIVCLKRNRMKNISHDIHRRRSRRRRIHNKAAKQRIEIVIVVASTATTF